MIDITIGNNQVVIENKIYHSFNVKNNLIEMINHLLYQACYSGEHIIVFKINTNNVKEYVSEYFSNPVGR